MAHSSRTCALPRPLQTLLEIVFRSYTIYLHRSKKRDISEAERGEVAEWVASVKVVATDTALRVTVASLKLGARATAAKVGLDRFWRDVRIHTLHDPVAYKKEELGRFVLGGQIPTPTWYT